MWEIITRSFYYKNILYMYMRLGFQVNNNRSIV